jgi:hypothetical protein
MAEKDSQGPSLELPSLFRRKRAQEPSDTAGSTHRAESSADEQDTAALPLTRTAPTSAPEPTTAVGPRSEPASAESSETEKTRRLAPRLSLPTVGSSRSDREGAGTAAPAEPSGPGPETAPAAGAPARAAAQHSTSGAGTATQERATGASDAQPEERRRSRRTLPELAATTAALVVGAVVGLLGVVLTFLGLQGCQLVAGTSSCGGPGLLVLVAIFVAMVLAGAAALKLFGVPEAGSVSFLGTGLLMVILLIFFLEALDHASMVFVIPALTAPCFALARWVTTQLSEDVMEDR